LDPTVETTPVAVARRRAEQAARRADRLRAKRKNAGRRVNATDPQSRVMKTRQGWLQGYNNQTAVSEDGIILAVRTTNDPTDIHHFQPVMAAAVEAVTTMGVAAGEPDRAIGTVIADAGYFSASNLAADGPDRLIAAGKKHDITGDKPRSSAGTEPQGTRRTSNEARRETCNVMIERLRQPDSAQLYRRRAAIVEPVNGHLKDRRGLRRFSRRGLNAAAAEFTTTAWVTNLMKLFTTSPATA
jgi:hypothetical protein